MMQSNLFLFNEAQLLAFGLLFIRVSAFIVAWPIFGSNLVPSVVKILFSLMLALALFPGVEWQNVGEELTSNALPILVVREAFIGICIGFLARMFFYAVSIGGQLISLSFGLTGSQLLNPSYNEYSTAIDQFQGLLATLFFLSLNGHHMLIQSLAQSFQYLPLATMKLNLEVFASMGQIVQNIVEMGMKMSAPAMAAIFMTNIVMAIMGRAVPQLNVLITSLPVNIMVGLGVLIVAMPLMFTELTDLAQVTSLRISKVLKSM